MPRIRLRSLRFAVLVFAALHPVAAQDAEWTKELSRRNHECDKLLAGWRRTHDPKERASLRDEVVPAAIEAQRPEVVEEIAADGRPARKEIAVPRRARRITLHELRVFDGIETTLGQENGYHSFDGATAEGWLVRRITRDAWEVWTPTHGWLFDGSGRLLNEAHPARGGGTGREWFGAFLPDGRWVTTDLEEMDCTPTFFSREGERVRQMTSAELTPPGPYNPGRALLGWARSDKDGAAWIVNVGSEAGYATVRVGPVGPARVLSGIERWQLCYPRALGPRGWYLSMNVPDDAGQTVLARMTAGHGVGVGFPDYSLIAAKDFSLEEFLDDKPKERDGPVDNVRLPDGNDVFGFWSGGRDVFVGTETTGEEKSRKRATYLEEGWVLDKTWFFNRRWRLQGWTRARRLADAADGRSLLLRMDDDGRIVTLRSDLHTAAVRRFVWSDGGTADAVTLFDDLRLGLFVRGGRLVLAGW